MIDIIHSLGPFGAQEVQASSVRGKEISNSNVRAQKTAGETAEETAKSFEAAFIAQMLQFSGLAKALTIGGGEAVESFTQFYLEELAKDITNNGGFGIADKISAYIKTKEETHGELGRL